jgi:hypothetical protein
MGNEIETLTEYIYYRHILLEKVESINPQQPSRLEWVVQYFLAVGRKYTYFLSGN